MSKHYQDVRDFLSRQPTPEQVTAFRPTPEAIARLRYLLEREANGKISSAELEELDELEQIEHLVVMLKADALSKLTKRND
ncbi:MAG: hypothetical protein ACREBD_28635 [Blastocatellia bacterium]